MKIRHALLLSVSALALVAASARAEVTVGVTAAVNQSAESTKPGTTTRTITLGDGVFHNEHIVTGPDGLVNILLVDGTSFTVGANSDLTIDSFVYDPAQGTAQVAATLTKGALRFIGGRTSKTGGATVNTPVGTVGIRGGMTDIIVGVETNDPSIPTNLVNCVFGVCSVGDTTFQAGQSLFENPDGGLSVVETTPAMAALGTNQVGAANENQGGGTDKKEEVAEKVNKATGSEEDAPEDPEGVDAGDVGDPSKDANQGTQTAPPINVRVLTSLNASNAANGLVGGDDDDQSITLSRVRTNKNQLFVGTGNLAEGAMRIPTYEDSTFTTHLVSGAISPFGSIGGLAYTNTGFAFYEFFYNAPGGPQPFYILNGVPTNFPVVFEGGDVRRYTFTRDPIQDVPVPFFLDGVLDDFTGATISDIYVVESPDTDEDAVRLLQTWLRISGSGADQQSAVGVTAGTFVDELENGGYGFRTGRSGSYRIGGEDPATFLHGAIGTLASADPGAEVFGPTGTNFVLSTDLSGDTITPFSDGDGDDFSTVHVANLVQQSAATGQSDRSLTGFAAGMLEGIGSPTAMIGTATPGVGVDFDAPTNSLGGTLSVSDFADLSYGQSLTALFGDAARVADAGGTTPGSYAGSSAFVNDNLFAAVQTGPDGVYFVTADTTSTFDFMPGGASICGTACSFAEWGWWGGEFDDGAIHLGTWAIGDIADWSEVNDDLAPTPTTFVGHAVGTVADVSGQYIAGGSVRLTWNEAMNLGLIAIDFDGVTYGGVVKSTGGTAALTDGFLYSFDDNGAVGLANAAFAANGANAVAGILGDFGLSIGDFSAAGTVLGANSSGAPSATVPLPYRMLSVSGANGVVGGSAGTDQTKSLQLAFDPTLGLKSTGTIVGGALSLKAFASDTSGSEAIGVGEASLGGTPLLGNAYFGPGLFAAYLLGLNGDVAQPFYAITGQGSPADVFDGTSVRAYTLSAGLDPDVPVPFFRDGLVSFDTVTPDYASTDLYVVENESSQLPQLLQAWLQIDGSGSAQQSAVGLTLGSVGEAGDVAGLEGDRYGSYRSTAASGIGSLSGTLATVAGPDGSEVFGPNGENLVLSGGLGATGTLTDSEGATTTDFNTVHVATLQNGPVVTTKTLDGTLTGFAAAMVESDGVTGMTSGAGPTLAVNFDKTAGTLGGALSVSAGEASLSAAFGTAANVETATNAPVDGSYVGTSAFINDNLFAAVQSGPGSTYFVTADAVPDYDFLAPNTLCGAACSFAEWGWWGGAQEDGAVHLGTWVAGNISTWADATPALSLSGPLSTYVGQGIGTVADGTAQFVDGGAMKFTWNSTLNLGLLSVTGLDGETYGGVVHSVGAAEALLGTLLYRESLDGSGPLDDVGVAHAAFAANGVNPIAGILGDFGVSNGNYSAAGTLLGAYDALATAATAPLPYRILTADAGTGIVATDVSKTLTLAFDETLGLKSTGDIEIASADVPLLLKAYVSSTNGSEEIQAGEASLNGEDLLGNAYFGPGMFAAYILGNATQTLYAITGQGSPSDVFDGTSVRAYTLSAGLDPDVPVPFFRDGLIDFNTATPDYASSALYVIENGTPVPQMLQAWLQISGSGSAQESAVGLTLGTLGATGSVPGLQGDRYGSYRSGAENEIVSLSGAVETAAGPDGSEVFGPNGENLVLSGGLGATGTLTDSEGATTTDFNTVHVATLQSGPVVTTKTLDGTLTGFAAAMVESGGVTGMTSGAAPTLAVNFDGAAGTLGGALTVSGGEASLTATFGTAANVTAAGGALPVDYVGTSAFINDNLFAAVQSGPGSTYFITADAVPDYDFLPSGTLCGAACSFAEWGWWGGAQAGGSVHLGTWVAGDVSDWADVTPALALPVTGLTTYVGQAVGTVADGAAQFVDGGAMRFTWNSTLNLGLLSVTGLDGETYGGVVHGADEVEALLGALLYRETFDGSGPLDDVGVAHAAFAADDSNPIAGLLGDFGISNGNYSAAGTLLGAYDALATAATAPLPYRILTADAGTGIVATDVSKTLTLAFDEILGLKSTGDIEIASADVPLLLKAYVSSTNGSEEIEAGEASLDGDDLLGSAYFGPDMFAAYILGNATQTLYAITGEGSPADVFDGTSVRAYTLSAGLDPDVPVPFFRDELIDFSSPTASYASTALYVVENESSQLPQLLHAWLQIDGTGAAQTSALGLTLGSLGTDGSVPGLGGERYGSYRGASENGSLAGSIATAAGPDGSEVFGPNGDNFVLSGLLNQTGTLLDITSGTDATFNTVHVATLQNDAVTATKTLDGTLTGFAAGAVSSQLSYWGNPYNETTLALSGSTADVEITFDSAAGTVGGSITVAAAPGSTTHFNALTAGFGGATGPSAYIDDNIFAAAAGATSTTSADFTGDEVPTPSQVTLTQTPSSRAGTYVAPASAVPQADPAYMGGEAFCQTCGFIKWGWWGTNADLQGAAPEATAQASTHLGTWVAGKVSTYEDLQNYDEDYGPTSNMRATYNGHAVGTVVNNGAQYTAGGAMQMGWNFGARTGDWSVSNYDGKNFGGDVSNPGSIGAATFSGAVDIDGAPSSSGVVNGAFVSNGVDPAAGVIGDFAVSDPDSAWASTGIFAGSQTTLLPLPPPD